MKQLLLTSALLAFSMNVFAEGICFSQKYIKGIEFESCEVGDILLMKIKSGKVNKQHQIVADYCD